MRRTLVLVLLLSSLEGHAAIASMIYPTGGRSAFQQIESSEFSPLLSAADIDCDFDRVLSQTLVAPPPRAVSLVASNQYVFGSNGFSGSTSTAAIANGGSSIFAKATADFTTEFLVDAACELELSGRFVIFYNNATSLELLENGVALFTLPYGPGDSENTFSFNCPAKPGNMYELVLHSYSEDTDTLINSFGAYIEFAVATVPEPGTIELSGFGLLTCLAFGIRRRK